MEFTIRGPQEIVFGPGVIAQLPERAATLGRRPLVVLGRGALRASGRLDTLLTALEQAGLEPTLFEGIEHDPSVQTVDRGRNLFRKASCDCVVAVGGGSVLDAGKAIAGLAREEAPTAEFVAGRAIEAESYPVIAAPTTAGTGSEVTHVAVLTDPDRRVKASIRTAGMMPRVALVDPELTLSLPPETTAHTGLDAFVQAVESYLSVGANPFSDALALDAVVRIGQWLRTAYHDGANKEAREQMACGSMMAGLALASARLGLVHGIAHPLGALYGLPHGKACALLLPHVLEFNAPVCDAKMAQLARALGVSQRASDVEAAYSLVVWARELCAELGCWMPFREFGLKEEDFEEIVAATLASGSTKSNPRKVKADDVRRLLRAAM
jgi:alcohol dehydrogenase class IV